MDVPSSALLLKFNSIIYFFVLNESLYDKTELFGPQENIFSISVRSANLSNKP